MKILIVEDEHDMLNSITSFFARVGYVCEIATTYREADEKVKIYEYDCAILDISLPDGNGLHILEQLKRRKPKCGVIIVSAKNSTDDKVKGLEIGADDYLAKPFHLSELNARVGAIVRRLKFEGNSSVQIGNISIQIENQKVYIKLIEVVLKKKEYEILLFFISNMNRVVSKMALAEHIWGDHADSVDSYEFLYAQIKNLRKSLGLAGADYNIQAVYGIGYKFISQ